MAILEHQLAYIKPMRSAVDREKSILFVYIGSEQGSWGNIAFPRPWHYYLMPGVRYCAMALKNDPEIKGACAIECRYFNRTVQDTDAIAAQLLDNQYDLVGFSSYCWNIADSCSLAMRIKEQRPGTTIMMGGPEVSMRDRAEADAFFGKNPAADCLVFGEAEQKLPALVKALLLGRRELLPDLRGFALAPRRFLRRNPANRDLLSLRFGPLPVLVDPEGWLLSGRFAAKVTANLFL